MAGVTAQGGTFSYNSNVGPLTAFVTGLSVETPQATLVDVTPIDAPASDVVIVPTGEWTGGSISVQFLHIGGAFNADSYVRSYGPLTFASAGFSVTRNVVCESATAEASVNDIVRGTAKFRWTDYTG